MAAAAPAEAAPACGDKEPVPVVGLSLAALRSFVKAREAESYTVTVSKDTTATLPFAALTTKQVCEAVVKPSTLDVPGGACSYAELLQSQARRAGGGHACAAPAR